MDEQLCADPGKAATRAPAWISMAIASIDNIEMANMIHQALKQRALPKRRGISELLAACDARQGSSRKRSSGPRFLPGYAFHDRRAISSPRSKVRAP